MKYEIKYLILLLFVLMAICMSFIHSQDASDWISAMNVTSECDMKKKIKASKCAECDKILIGLECIDCEKNKCTKCRHLIPPEEIEGTKCPCCGSDNLTETQLVKEDKCLFCDNPVKMVDVCVKQVYTCLEHAEFNDLKPNKCRELVMDDKGNEKPCDKKLILVRTVYSEIRDYFVCPKCNTKYEQSGKCEACKQALFKKKLCRDSTIFPHVNEADWNKTMEKYPPDDKLVLNSKAEVKVFEGTRRPQLKSWTYLTYDPKTKEAALVDASCDADELAKFIEEKQLNLKYIFLTHSHTDHMVTYGQIQNKFRKAKQLRFGNLKDNDYVKLGGLTLKIFHTPGHLDNCIVIWVGRMLFTGDSFDVEIGCEKTKKSLKIRGAFTIYGGHSMWSESY